MCAPVGGVVEARDYLVCDRDDVREIRSVFFVHGFHAPYKISKNNYFIALRDKFLRLDGQAFFRFIETRKEILNIFR